MHIITKNLLEIRFNANPRFFDYRGRLISSVAANTGLNQWSLLPDNKIEFRKEPNDQKLFGFVSYNSFGLSFETPNNLENTKIIVRSFLKAAWPYINNSEIRRVGYRILSYKKVSTFDKILSGYKSNLVVFHELFKETLDSDVEDIGIALVCRNEKKCNITMGPMKKVQAKEIFKNQDKISNSGMFLDYDYYDEAPIKITPPNIELFMEKATTKADNLLDSIEKIITL